MVGYSQVNINSLYIPYHLPLRYSLPEEESF